MAQTQAVDSRRWYEHLKDLQKKEEAELGEAAMGPCCNLHIVATIRAAAAAAKRDDDWKDSGVQEMLLNALKVAEQGDCSGAVASAMGVLAFLQGRESALNRRFQGNRRVPWDPAEQRSQQASSGGGGRDDAATGSEVLHTRSADEGTEQAHHARDAAAAEAVAEVTANGESGSAGDVPAAERGARGAAGQDHGDLRKSVSDPDKEPAHKRQRGEAPSPPPPPRSLSDPSPPASSMDALIQAAGSRPRTGPSLDGSGSNNRLGSISSDEGFPGHNSVEDAYGDSNVLRKAKQGIFDVAKASGSYWAGKVKHKLGASTVELFFLSALLPVTVIEHMPSSLYVTDLVQRSTLSIDEAHSVVRCRLDFVTNRQLRKLRTLADLRLAAVSSLQHSALTLVPFIDNIGGLRIIGFVKVETA